MRLNDTDRPAVGAYFTEVFLLFILNKVFLFLTVGHAKDTGPVRRNAVAHLQEHCGQDFESRKAGQPDEHVCWMWRLLLPYDSYCSRRFGGSGACSVKWDLKEMRAQHDPFVDTLVQDLKFVAGRFASQNEFEAFAFSHVFCLDCLSTLAKKKWATDPVFPRPSTTCCGWKLFGKSIKRSSTGISCSSLADFVSCAHTLWF